jgi:hypothetical protein
MHFEAPAAAGLLRAAPETAHQICQVRGRLAGSGLRAQAARLIRTGHPPSSSTVAGLGDEAESQRIPVDGSGSDGRTFKSRHNIDVVIRTVEKSEQRARAPGTRKSAFRRVPSGGTEGGIPGESHKAAWVRTGLSCPKSPEQVKRKPNRSGHSRRFHRRLGFWFEGSSSLFARARGRKILGQKVTGGES